MTIATGQNKENFHKDYLLELNIINDVGKQRPTLYRMERLKYFKEYFSRFLFSKIKKGGKTNVLICLIMTSRQAKLNIKTHQHAALACWIIYVSAVWKEEKCHTKRQKKMKWCICSPLG